MVTEQYKYILPSITAEIIANSDLVKKTTTEFTHDQRNNKKWKLTIFTINCLKIERLDITYTDKRWR